MVRLSIVLLLGLVVMGCSLANPIESGAELIQAAFNGRLLYGRYLQWSKDQPADSDKSFATFYKSIKGEAVKRQLAQREAGEEEPTETLYLGKDNGELQNLYKEWKKIQPEGSSVSFENYLEWLSEQRTVRELGEDGSDAADDVVIKKRGCDYYCSCCPLRCEVRCLE